MKFFIHHWIKFLFKQLLIRKLKKENCININKIFIFNFFNNLTRSLFEQCNWIINILGTSRKSTTHWIRSTRSRTILRANRKGTETKAIRRWARDCDISISSNWCHQLCESTILIHDDNNYTFYILTRTGENRFLKNKMIDFANKLFSIISSCLSE